MVNIMRTCDICGKAAEISLNVKYKVKAKRRWFRVRVWIKDESWDEADICDDCMNEIRKAVRKKREDEYNANSN